MSLCRDDLNDINMSFRIMSGTGWPDVGNPAMGSGASEVIGLCVACGPLTSISGAQKLPPGDAVRCFVFQGFWWWGLKLQMMTHCPDKLVCR